MITSEQLFTALDTEDLLTFQKLFSEAPYEEKVKKNADGKNLLMAAAEIGKRRLMILSYLINSTLFNINEQDSKGRTALINALDTSIVILLLEKGANPEIAADGVTPLMLAAANGRVEKLSLLLRSPLTKIDTQNTKGITALIAASIKGRLEVVNALIAAGANINVRKGHFTPLEWAVKKGHRDVAEALLKAGADKMAVNPATGQTPYEYACIVRPDLAALLAPTNHERLENVGYKDTPKMFLDPRNNRIMTKAITMPNGSTYGCISLAEYFESSDKDALPCFVCPRHPIKRADLERQPNRLINAILEEFVVQQEMKKKGINVPDTRWLNMKTMFICPVTKSPLTIKSGHVTLSSGVTVSREGLEKLFKSELPTCPLTKMPLAPEEKDTQDDIVIGAMIEQVALRVLRVRSAKRFHSSHVVEEHGSGAPVSKIGHFGQ